MSRKNYTEREKQELLAIVEKYKHVIENKRTNAVSIELKNKFWEKISIEFNAGADTYRTAKQLNTAYQNLKRITRQNVAEKNMQNYKESNMQIDLKQFKKDRADDKKAILATGGGTFTPKLSEVGAQMLALMGDQITPLSNNCDSASSYHSFDVGEHTQSIIFDVIEPTVECIDQNDMDTTISAYGPTSPLCPVPPSDNNNQKSKINSKLGKRRIIHPLKQKNKKCIPLAAIKRKYYERKFDCALVEKNTNVIKHRIARKKEKLVDLEIKLKQMEYETKLKTIKMPNND